MAVEVISEAERPGVEAIETTARPVTPADTETPAERSLARLPDPPWGGAAAQAFAALVAVTQRFDYVTKNRV